MRTVAEVTADMRRLMPLSCGEWADEIDAAVVAAASRNAGEVRDREGLAEVAAFLCGEAPLNGRWFGDPVPPTGGGSFWWREHLRRALSTPAASVPPGMVRDSALVERLRKAASACEQWRPGGWISRVLTEAAEALSASPSAPQSEDKL